MKGLIPLLVLGLAVAFTAPAFAQDAAPTTKADCEKTKDMKWDTATRKCVKK
jgi:hypothetical protein